METRDEKIHLSEALPSTRLITITYPNSAFTRRVETTAEIKSECDEYFLADVIFNNNTFRKFHILDKKFSDPELDRLDTALHLLLFIKAKNPSMHITAQEFYDKKIFLIKLVIEKTNQKQVNQKIKTTLGKIDSYPIYLQQTINNFYHKRHELDKLNFYVEQLHIRENNGESHSLEIKKLSDEINLNELPKLQLKIFCEIAEWQKLELLNQEFEQKEEIYLQKLSVIRKIKTDEDAKFWTNNNLNSEILAAFKSYSNKPTPFINEARNFFDSKCALLKIRAYEFYIDLKNLKICEENIEIARLFSNFAIMLFELAIELKQNSPFQIKEVESKESTSLQKEKGARCLMEDMNRLKIFSTHHLANFWSSFHSLHYKKLIAKEKMQEVLKSSFSFSEQVDAFMNKNWFTLFDNKAWPSVPFNFGA